MAKESAAALTTAIDALGYGPTFVREPAEQKPGQRMRPHFAPQGLGDGDDCREHGERD